MAQTLIFDSKELKLSYDKDTQLYVIQWLEDALNLDEQQFKDKNIFIVAKAKENPLKKVLVDTRNVIYPVTDELTMWLMENVNKPILEHGAKKVAFLYPKDYLTKLGIEGYFSEIIKSERETRFSFFDDLDKAMQWLLED